ncbi:MAG: hypothetical protein CMA57_03625 [Euryarchaeota archaeon]|nr:hypothetical protein [Euryarchaeota archaeon]|tara:strand:+ start:7970 stop:8167 length:198 start_codon:yes stop_codon:yes gene_type:complete
MDELMNLLVKDESPSQISDSIKDILFAKAAGKIENIRPNIAGSVFDGGEEEVGTEVSTELEGEVE